MARSGQTIASPPIGQQITFLRTASDTGGELLELEASMEPGSRIPEHVHLHQEERFEVLEGTASFWVRGQQLLRGPGEELVIPPRTRHRFRNDGDVTVRVRAQLRPALRAEDVFEALFTLGAQGRVNRFGAPSPRRTARLLREHRDDFFYLARIPPALQRALLLPLALP
jgi:mannose-6-phosphate isomerase-like protein (cupin superfamily)